MFTALVMMLATANAASVEQFDRHAFQAKTNAYLEENVYKKLKTPVIVDITPEMVADQHRALKRTKGARIPRHGDVAYHMVTKMFATSTDCHANTSPIVGVDQLVYSECVRSPDGLSQINHGCSVEPNGDMVLHYDVFNNPNCEGAPYFQHNSTLDLPPSCSLMGDFQGKFSCMPGDMRPWAGVNSLVSEEYHETRDCKKRKNPASFMHTFSGQCLMGYKVESCNKKQLSVSLFDNPGCQGQPVHVDDSKLKKNKKTIKKDCDKHMSLDSCNW